MLGPALADRESVGEQDLVGGRPEVRAEMATRSVSEDGATQLLDSRGRLDRPHVAVSPRCRVAYPELALERERPVDDRLRRRPIAGLRAERRDSHR